MPENKVDREEGKNGKDKNGKAVHDQEKKGNTYTHKTLYSFQSRAFTMNHGARINVARVPPGTRTGRRGVFRGDGSPGGGLGAQLPTLAASRAHALSRPRVTRPVDTRRRPEASRLSPQCYWLKKKHKHMSSGGPRPLLGVRGCCSPPAVSVAAMRPRAGAPRSHSWPPGSTGRPQLARSSGGDAYSPEPGRQAPRAARAGRTGEQRTLAAWHFLFLPTRSAAARP